MLTAGPFKAGTARPAADDNWQAWALYMAQPAGALQHTPPFFCEAALSALNQTLSRTFTWRGSQKHTTPHHLNAGWSSPCAAMSCNRADCAANNRAISSLPPSSATRRS